MGVRRPISPRTRQTILTEAGYKCGNPKCAEITLDVHHIEPVESGGSNDESNLIALCANCHARITRNSIPLSAAKVWKGVLVRLNGAFARETIDLLRFLAHPKTVELRYRGGDVLRFAPLVAAGLADIEREQKGPGSVMVTGEGEDALRHAHDFFDEVEAPELDDTWQVRLSAKGKALVDSWLEGEDKGGLGL